MLSYFYENDFIRLSDETPENWEEAIRLSCQTFLEKGLIDERYEEEIIECVKKYGPYIVLIPGVAMPHSQEDSKGVHGTGISFTKFKRPISFEKGNPEKEANLFFTLASNNSIEHMQNIAELSELLMTEGLVQALTEMNTMEDFEKIMKEFDQIQ